MKYLKIIFLIAVITTLFLVNSRIDQIEITPLPDSELAASPLDQEAYSLPQVNYSEPKEESISVNSSISLNQNNSRQAEPTPQVSNKVFAWGFVETEYGLIPLGEEVKLYSQSRNKAYTARSDVNGYFSFTDVESADDYTMTVAPKGLYKRVTKKHVSILYDQVDLSIILESLPVSILNGRIVNVEGVAIPSYRVKVQSQNKSRWIKNIETDAIGEFRMDDVPIGPLEFTKTFGQSLFITGYTFEGEFQAPVELTVDIGLHELGGIVYDQFNDVIPGASVVLSWRHGDGKIRTSFNRRDTTNPEGKFRFTDIGSGMHQLLITAFRNLTFDQMIDVGNSNEELTIVLLESLSSEQ